MGPAAFVCGIWCNLDVTRPVASLGEELSLYSSLYRVSKQLESEAQIWRTSVLAIHFVDCFGATSGDFVKFFAILELRRPLEGLSVSIYSKICWNMLWNIDGPARIFRKEYR